MRSLFRLFTLMAIVFAGGVILIKLLYSVSWGESLEIADQFADALACGFDEVDLPETMANRQPVQQWLEAKDAMSVHYQTGYGAARSILQQRLAARR